MKLGGQLDAEVIGQSAAAIAVWHDFLDQSTKIYRAIKGLNKVLIAECGSACRGSPY